MTLVVETGTGSATADSYASLEQAEARHNALGSAWAGSDTAKEQALRRATVFMEQAYGERWKGTRLLRAQALSWPRYGVIAREYPVESNIVPVEVVNTCIDLALKATAGDLYPDQTRAVKREKVGPLETEYADYAAPGIKYASSDAALAPYLRWQGGVMCGLTRS